MFPHYISSKIKYGSFLLLFIDCQKCLYDIKWIQSARGYHSCDSSALNLLNVEEVFFGHPRIYVIFTNLIQVKFNCCVWCLDHNIDAIASEESFHTVSSVYETQSLTNRFTMKGCTRLLKDPDSFEWASQCTRYYTGG